MKIKLINKRLSFISDKFRCIEDNCKFFSDCNKSKTSKLLNLKKCVYDKFNIILPINVYYEKSSNLSGTSYCPYQVSRIHSCEDCKNITYDANDNGYCLKHKQTGKNRVVTDKGCSVKDCKHFELSEQGNNWNRETGCKQHYVDK